MDQKGAFRYKKEEGLIIISGYYEGIDERLFSLFDIERVSIGDVVLSSGDLPALTIAESVLRLLPNVIGNKNSVEDDSIINGLLEGPHYTQPRELYGQNVPEIVLSGNHPEIKRWQKRESLRTTLHRRPDLLSNTLLSQEDKTLMTELLKE